MSKFVDAFAEAIYLDTLTGTEAETGDSVSWHMWAAVMHYPEDTTGKILNADGRSQTVPIPAGWYLVTENTHGFVTVLGGTEEQVTTQFYKIDTDYIRYE